MKKFVAVMIFAFVAAFSVNFCSANYYDDSPDYVYITTHQGTYYLYLPSVDVQEYNPPHYQIAGDIVHVSGFNGKESWWNIVIRYNWYTKETFRLNDSNSWVKEDITGDNFAASRRKRNIADALFRAAYNMDFYGY